MDDRSGVPEGEGLAGARFFVAAPPTPEPAADAVDLVVVATDFVVEAAAPVAFGAAAACFAPAAFFVPVACFFVAPASAADSFFAFAMV
jgi:hypothetical protein